jgi:hypothetical protein
MGSNNVVSTRVEALGVSITIADGSIAIEHTKTELPTAAPKVESPVAQPAEQSGQAPLSPNAWPRLARVSTTARSVETWVREIPHRQTKATITVGVKTKMIREIPHPTRSYSHEIPLRAKRPGLAKRNRYGAMKRSRN